MNAFEQAARWGRRGTAGAAFAKRLTLENLGRIYEGRTVLEGVDADIEPGAIVCLLGASGSGKSTLLRLIAGLEAPSMGRILMDGTEVSGPSGFLPPEKRGVGMVFQDFALFPHQCNLDNVMFGLKALPRDMAKSEATHMLKRVGLAHLAQQFPHNLSGGEQQRVALARAIAPRPGIILMDEPFSGLDRQMRSLVRNETLALLRETRATAIIVTHDPEEAMIMADHIILMRNGRVVQQGSVRELYRHPVDLEVVRYFCDANEVEGLVRNGKLETPLGFFPAAHLKDGQRGVAAIRPDDVMVKPPGLCIPGRIMQHKYLGLVETLEIAVAGLDFPLKVRLRRADGLKVGADVGVDIATAEVLVFSQEGP